MNLKTAGNGCPTPRYPLGQDVLFGILLASEIYFSITSIGSKRGAPMNVIDITLPAEAGATRTQLRT
jgi:hypothetical protein